MNIGKKTVYLSSENTRDAVYDPGQTWKEIMINIIYFILSLMDYPIKPPYMLYCITYS
jgi:hypothetical protein